MFSRFASPIAVLLIILLTIPQSFASNASDTAPRRDNSAGKGGQTPSHAADDDRDEQTSDDERYIVKFRPGTANPRGLVRDNGGEVIIDIHGFDAVAARLPEQALNGLRNHPSVEYVEIDARRYPMQVTSSWSDVVSGSEIIPYGIQMVQADQLTDAAVGNRRVCIIDSGFFRLHDDLQNVNVTASTDAGTGDPYRDRDGHGTHVAGTIAAIGGNGTGVRGVIQNQKLNLHIVKVFGDDGAWAYSSSLVNAVTECRNAGSNIISMSLGGGGSTTAENTAFTNAYNAGVLSIAAAGNDGTTALSYPASYSTVVSVAAVDSDENHADFSQRNNQVELAAPGVAVLSTVPYKETNTFTVGGVTYRGNYIDFAARNTGVTGPLVSGGRCTATNGAWNGQVVLCERGDVSFWDKVRNVQNSGGRAAVIYNNASGNFFGTLEPNTSTIPAISLSQEDGQGILAAGVLGQPATVVSHNQNPATFGYDYFNGTSMATPHVSAVAALIWSYNPSWTNAQIRTALQQTAKDKGTAGRDNLYGHGIIQAKAALDRLCATTGSGCTAPATPPPAATSGCMTDTTVNDFETGDSASVSTVASPGDVVLHKSGATESLDVVQDSSGNFGNTISTTSWQGQTFRPTASGQLSRLDLSFFCNSCTGTQPVRVEIRTTSGGLPTSTVLASTDIPAFAGGTAYRTAIFDNPATVTANTQYAYVVRVLAANGAGSYAHNRTQNDAYSGGTVVSSANGGSTWTTSGQDFRFKSYISVGVNLYAFDGYVVSSIKDSVPPGANSISWGNLSWNATLPSAATRVEFQVAGSNSAGGPFQFVGPDGTPDSYFVTSGASLAQFNGSRFLRYKAFLRTVDQSQTPVLRDVTLCFSTAVPSATVTLSNLDHVYDGSAKSATVTTDPAGLPVTVTYNGSATPPVDAGTYSVLATVTDPNYASSSASGTLVIQKAAATLSLSNLTHTFDGTPKAATVSVSPTGLSGVTLTYDRSSLAPVNAGSYEVVASLDHPNYTALDAVGTLTISKAQLQISVNGYTGTYDGDAHGASGTVTGVQGEDLSELLDLGNSFINVPGGTANWTFNAGGSNPNYESASGQVTISIAKANATIAVDGYSGTYDGNAHAATGSATGVKGENLSDLLDLGASFTNVPGGTAHWTFAGSENYNAANGSAAIEIAPRPLVITADDQTMVRNSALPSLTGTVMGALVSDGIAGSFTTTANGRSLGEFPIVASAIDPDERLGNYAVSLVPGTLYVVEAAIQACTPGFWQGGSGAGLWNVLKDADWKGQLAQPYAHATEFNKFFTAHSALNQRSMFDVVGMGATSVAAQKAGRALVAGYLNTSHKSGYGYTQQQLRDKWTAAVRSGDNALHQLAEELDALNNLFDCRR